MFGTEPTPLDVRLVAFRIPIRVSPSFWIATVLLGSSSEDPRFIFLWVVSVFISIIVHELGHAMVAEAFGWPSEILLYWGGGLAFSQRLLRWSAWKDLGVTLAGPFAGFGFYLLVRYGIRPFVPFDFLIRNPWLAVVMYDLLLINLYWGLINLIPALPLDGGHAMRAVFSLVRVRDPDLLAAKVSIPVSAAAAAYFYGAGKGYQFAAVLFTVICVQNVATAASRNAPMN